MAPADPSSRSDRRAAETANGADHDARIEQLLLAGLDAYFAGAYEQAINLWTRVLFLDRHHDRARAYIDRARSTQAERQRETDAVLHQGLEAFREGDVARAEQLITDALDRGASGDEAHGLLARIERLGRGRSEPLVGRRLPPTRQLPDLHLTVHAPTPRVKGWMAAALLASAGVGVLAVALWGLTLPEPATWPWPGAAAQANARSAAPLVAATLPVQRPSDGYLARARSHVQTGRLHDALVDLDRIQIGDVHYAEAERLRGDIQRALLEVAPLVRPAGSGRPE